MNYFAVVPLIVLLIISCVMFFGDTCYEFFSENCLPKCVNAHSQTGENYVWLNVLGYGNVIKVEFEEPVGSNNWTLYTDKWWETHCKVVDHSPEKLVESHVNAFIGPNRFARLRYTFQNGKIMEPTQEFYELEAKYFKNQNLCKN
ncbi:MAG: hypothetical protein Edafosvirus9_4 [Edafosvirus sp.]|uniref:Uncharacterized protein n=1 Tax=Edafosvirus sp. TaxID=2487765 RepID=A0A3G4ZTR5_9VIRU|nr:MAG: hypothetical protein Edafosvirus9_4 [Edafosvirus sp.]